MLGVFLCFYATCFVCNFDQKTIPGGENKPLAKTRMPKLHNGGQSSPEVSKSDRNDFTAEKITR